MAPCCGPAKAESVHLYLDCHDGTQACAVFQRGTVWLLVAWDLTTGETRRGQWLGHAKLQLCDCALYRGFFRYRYYEMKEGMRQHAAVSRAPFFTALLHLQCTCCEGLFLLESESGEEPRVAVRGDPAAVHRLLGPDRSSVQRAPDGRTFRKGPAGEAVVPPTGPRFSSKPTVAPTEGSHLGRAYRLEQARVFVDGRLALDLTGAAFERVEPPAGYR